MVHFFTDQIRKFTLNLEAVNMNKKEDGFVQEPKTELDVVVSGAAVTLEVNLNQPLKSLVEKALKEANEASDPAQWGFFVEEGKKMTGIDENLKIEEFLKREQTLYLNKKAGVAG
jgi:hypothetical protein